MSSLTEAPSAQAPARIILRPGKARPLLGRHPWVLDSSIARMQGTPQDGDVVDLFGTEGRWIARGLYNGRSRMRVRLYSWTPGEQLDDAFLLRRIEAAIECRRQLGYDAPQGAARLIFSEADGLSGLIVDRFGPYLVVQVTALALGLRLRNLLPRLLELTHCQGAVIRAEHSTAAAEGLDAPWLVEQIPAAWGEPPPGPVFIEEHRLKYGVDLLEGQKTGFYLDQRDNRAAAARYATGRRVLDMFCYTGGFALTAATAGRAVDVLGIDSSERAIRVARANAELNSVTNVRFEEADAFRSLQELAIAGARFGLVVLDPPKFSRSRQGLETALRAYHRVNRLGVEVLEPGGILVTCSCSGSVSREDFLKMLVGVAQQSGRDLQVLEQRGAALDHPFSVTCLEGEYLKCFVCRVL